MPSTTPMPLTDDHWREVREALSLPDTVRPDLLCQAFSHSSFAREASLGPMASNQRLEFLGDAVLDLILAEHLFLVHPSLPEGRLTKMKATAVRSHSLARIATHIDLGRHLLLGRGEDESGGRNKRSLLADCFEALIGAIYLSTDLETTSEFVLAQFADVLEEIEAQEAAFDHKTALQELLQDLTKQTPAYKTVSALGPPHQRTFVVEVQFNGMTIGHGEGASKQLAQQAAAGDALAARDSWLDRLHND